MRRGGVLGDYRKTVPYASFAFLSKWGREKRGRVPPPTIFHSAARLTQKVYTRLSLNTLLTWEVDEDDIKTKQKSTHFSGY